MPVCILAASYFPVLVLKCLVPSLVTSVPPLPLCLLLEPGRSLECHWHTLLICPLPPVQHTWEATNVCEAKYKLPARPGPGSHFLGFNSLFLNYSACNMLVDQLLEGHVGEYECIKWVI